MRYWSRGGSMKVHNGMKSHDIAILLFIAQYADKTYKVADVGKSLHISQSEISESIHRSNRARLIDATNKQILRHGLYEFLIHGLRFVFPVIPGAVVRGIPTAHSAPPLNNMVVGHSDHYVWSHPDGTLRGMGIKPLYKTLPDVSLKYPEFYELLALLDAIRIGKKREVNFATQILKERLIHD